jgi:hypothetical protein
MQCSYINATQRFVRMLVINATNGHLVVFPAEYLEVWLVKTKGVWNYVYILAGFEATEN